MGLIKKHFSFTASHLSCTISLSTSSAMVNAISQWDPSLLKILSFDARSLLPKITQLRGVCLSVSFDVIVVTCTWLSLDILDSELWSWHSGIWSSPKGQKPPCSCHLYQHIYPIFSAPTQTSWSDHCWVLLWCPFLNNCWLLTLPPPQVPQLMSCSNFTTFSHYWSLKTFPT